MIDSNLTHYYKTLHKDGNIPQKSIDYLQGIKNILNFEPTVIYDIGSAVLHWAKNAKTLWPNAKIIAFEALREVEDFYKDYGIDYQLGVFSNQDNNEVTFYEHPLYLGGNSYYKENSKFSPAAEKIYDKEHESKRITTTIDTAVLQKNFPLPDFVKIDVQGAEIDILNGMRNTLKDTKHLIIELQHVEYNLGAKQVNESIPFIESLGFKLVDPTVIFSECRERYFCGNGPDADYHFIRI